MLRQMKAATDAARTQGLPPLATAQRQAIVARYQELLAARHTAHPPPERRPKQRGWGMRTPAQNLLGRLWLGQGQDLAFLHDHTIPFDNHQAERDGRIPLRRWRGGVRAQPRLRLLPKEAARYHTAGRPRNRLRRPAALPGLCRTGDAPRASSEDAGTSSVRTAVGHAGADAGPVLHRRPE